METFNEKIKRIRKSLGLTQVNVCEKIGITQPSFASIESGKTTSITIDLGKQIAQALGVTFYELFDIAQNKEKEEALLDEIERLKELISEQKKMIAFRSEQFEFYKQTYVLIYQQSFMITERMIDLLVDQFIKIRNEPNFTISVAEVREKAIIQIKKEFADFFDYKTRIDIETTNKQ